MSQATRHDLVLTKSVWLLQAILQELVHSPCGLVAYN